MPGDLNSHFFSIELLKEEERRADRLAKRNNCKIILPLTFHLDMQEKAGESEQFDFDSNSKTARRDNRVVSMHHGWTTKKVSDVRFKDTHHSLFGASNY
jgi:hypothetical protein